MTAASEPTAQERKTFPQAAENTDRELWREPSDEPTRDPDGFYCPSIFVTKGGGIGIDVGGTVFVKPIREWHSLAQSALGTEIPSYGSSSEIHTDGGQPSTTGKD